MATLVGLQTDLNSLVKNLIELNFDAIEAYDAAIARVTRESLRTQLLEFREDHDEHIEELSRVLRDCGCTPPKGPDFKRVLMEGKVMLAGLVGDRAILYALRTIEHDTNVAYERASRSDAVPRQLKELLRASLADECRHREWLDEQLEGQEPPYAAPGGPAI